MQSLLLTIVFILVLLFVFCTKESNSTAKPSALKRFRKDFTSKEHLQKKAKDIILDSLMIDPQTNISISEWEEEKSLREKADIHRARLNKYGKSKMNGEVFFMSSNGKVFKYTSKGKKDYV